MQFDHLMPVVSLQRFMLEAIYLVIAAYLNEIRMMRQEGAMTLIWLC